MRCLVMELAVIRVNRKCIYNSNIYTMKIDVDLLYRYGILAGRVKGGFNVNLTGDMFLGKGYQLAVSTAVKANLNKIRLHGITGKILINGKAIYIGSERFW